MRTWGWAGLLIVAALLAPLAVVAPEFLLRPFQVQGPGQLELAYRLRAWRGPVTLLLAAGGLVSLLMYWRVERVRFRRALTLIPLLVLVASASLARDNLAEWLFSPVRTLRFVAAAEATDVGAADMVLGVRFGSWTKAYPVRILAYHHVVNDVLAGQPYVATY